jgi:hypothetical protein
VSGVTVSSALDLAERTKEVLEKSVAQNAQLLTELKESRAMCERLLSALTDVAARAFVINREMSKVAYSPSFIRNESAQICRDIEAALKVEKGS